MQEWRDALFLSYGLDTPDLPKFCDGRKTDYSIFHTLNCKKCGLVTAHHNEIHDGVADLDGKAFTPTHMHDNPLIFADSAMQITKEHPDGSTLPPSKNNSEATEKKGELLICDLWKNDTDSVHEICVMNTDAKYYLAKTPDKCLQ